MTLTARPICAVCKRPVDSFVEEQDPFADRITFIARCHGERERVTLEGKEVVRSLDFGMAFVAPKRLTP